MLSIPNRVAGIDFHSYSQLILRNWGWHEKILKALGHGMGEAIFRKSGYRYSSIKGSELYPASGCEDDWMGLKEVLLITAKN
jgi:hypothetical protein